MNIDFDSQYHPWTLSSLKERRGGEGETLNYLGVHCVVSFPDKISICVWGGARITNFCREVKLPRYSLYLIPKNLSMPTGYNTLPMMTLNWLQFCVLDIPRDNVKVCNFLYLLLGTTICIYVGIRYLGTCTFDWILFLFLPPFKPFKYGSTVHWIF